MIVLYSLKGSTEHCVLKVARPIVLTYASSERLPDTKVSSSPSNFVAIIE